MGGCIATPPRATTRSDAEAGEEFQESRSPRCVAFQSQQQNVKRPYLCCDAQGGAASGSRPLRLNGESVASPYTRFYIEPSREHDGLVHIRCCYDNRYWAAQQRAHDGSWVVGAAEEAEEDLSRPTCTLFRTTRVGPASGSIRLLHVHLEKYVCLPSSCDTMIKLEAVNPSLHKGEGDGQDAIACTYTVHDLSQNLVPPRYVAFKGDNDKYLRTRTMERHEYLQFSGHDKGDEAVLNTTHTNDDGTFRIRSNSVGKFWRRSPNWIWADSDGDATDSSGDTLFRAIRLSGTGGFFLALQNLGNDYFCKRLTTEGKRNCLNAGTPTISADARLQLEEAVVSREIYNVVFDLSKPRIYSRSAVTVATASALNGTTSNNTAKLALEYIDHMEKRIWGSSVTVKLLDGVVTSICTGIPIIIADGNVEVSSEFSGLYSWGSPVEKEITQKVTYEVTVPPKTMVTVASTATRASCDVPFSYTQRDTLVNGKEITYDMDDGLYTGVNFYDFKYVTREESM